MSAHEYFWYEFFVYLGTEYFILQFATSRSNSTKLLRHRNILARLDLRKIQAFKEICNKFDFIHTKAEKKRNLGSGSKIPKCTLLHILIKVFPISYSKSGSRREHLQQFGIHYSTKPFPIYYT